MIDPEMTKILQNLDGATNAPAGTPAKAKTNKDPMLAILEGFNEAGYEGEALTEEKDLNSGPGAQTKKQMPGTHKMGSMSSPTKQGAKHPAGEYLVGGEEGEPEAGEEVIAEYEEDEINDREFDSRFGDDPRREKYFGKEPSKKASGKVDIKRSTVFPGTYDEVDEDTISPKQTLSDIFRSIEEVDQERLNSARGEVQVKEKKKLAKNDKGTYDLSEAPQSISWYKKEIYAQLKAITARVRTCKDEEIAREVLRDLMEIEYTLGNTPDQFDEL